MAEKKDLRFKRFEQLIAICDSHKRTKNGDVIWLTVCDCGNYHFVPCCELLRGNTRSCGCLSIDKLKERNKDNLYAYKHGGKHLRLYRTWQNMKNRCYNKNIKFYKNYGGRGIIICDEWKNSFMEFQDWAKSFGYKNNLTIDRINNDGNYDSSNCQWITKAENTRKGNENRCRN